MHFSCLVTVDIRKLTFFLKQNNEKLTFWKSINCFISVTPRSESSTFSASQNNTFSDNDFKIFESNLTDNSLKQYLLRIFLT